MVLTQVDASASPSSGAGPGSGEAAGGESPSANILEKIALSHGIQRSVKIDRIQAGRAHDVLSRHRVAVLSLPWSCCLVTVACHRVKSMAAAAQPHPPCSCTPSSVPLLNRIHPLRSIEAIGSVAICRT